MIYFAWANHGDERTYTGEYLIYSFNLSDDEMHKAWNDWVRVNKFVQLTGDIEYKDGLFYTERKQLKNKVHKRKNMIMSTIKKLERKGVSDGPMNKAIKLLKKYENQLEMLNNYTILD